jgi:hypothetical protein
MKTKLFLLLFFFGFLAQSQEFAPIGAKWYYDHASGLSPYLTIIESTKDSTVLNHSCKVLTTKLISEQQTSYYNSYWDTTLVSTDLVYKSNDTIFHYNDAKKIFDTLYVFNASKNDTILVNKCTPNENCIDKFEYSIDSVSTINIATNTFKTLFIKPTESSTWIFNLNWNYKSYPIIENIGSTRYFWGSNDLGIMEGPVQKLRCYKENSFTYKPENITVECDYLKPINPSNIFFNTVEKIVYPNPFKTNIFINIAEFDEYEIFDVSNNSFLKGDCKNINTESLPNGIYFLKLRISENETKTIKIIKYMP